MTLINTTTRRARMPDGQTCFAVGDIHGRADLLEKMLDRLESLRADFAAAPIVVFLGDYIDRGPDSAAVLEMLLSGRPSGFERRFLKGNHEAAMLSFIDNPARNKSWLSHGGLETLASYGVDPLPSIGAGAKELNRARASLLERAPASHLAFLGALERYAIYGDYLFAHAGVDPKKRLEAQTDDDLFWIRDRFLNTDALFEKRVVHGHTPTGEAHRDRRRIGVDTGAYYSGRLTAACLEGENTTFVVVL